VAKAFAAAEPETVAEYLDDHEEELAQAQSATVFPHFAGTTVAVRPIKLN
jgi:hypothetical protein